jgi:DNA polymerase III epsilon subunit-like protein
MMIEYERMAWRRALSTIERSREDPPCFDSRHQRRSEIARRLIDWCALDIHRERENYIAADDVGLIDWGRECCVIDFETTGFDPHENDITEIAVIRTDRHLRPIKALHLLVVPQNTQIINKWVLENTRWGREGANIDSWRELGAISLEEALHLIMPFIADASPIAHFMPFETKWLRAALAPLRAALAHQVMSDQWLRNAICTRELSSPLRARGICGRSLADVCKALGIEHAPHDAMSDARACLEVARILLSGEI